MQRLDVNRLYRSFCDLLPTDLKDCAQELAHELRLTPVRGVGWNDVFKHELTLQAPLFVSEALRPVPTELCERAVFAHMMAVVAAFGTDRIADGQASRNADLPVVLEAMRKTRDGALRELVGAAGERDAHSADAITNAAIAEERRLFSTGQCVDLATYRDVSIRKQLVGLTASIALARASGADEAVVASIHDVLIATCMGLQCQDDAVDWEDDGERGGAWAQLLAGGVGQSVSTIDRTQLLASGSIARMLALGAAEYERGAVAARQLGAACLHEWLARRAEEAREQQAQEIRHPGYAARRTKLVGWLREVL